MVVGAPDVDELVETAAELLADIADVRGEVRGIAVGAIDHTVLVITEGGGAEPRGVVLLEDVAAIAKRVHCAADPAFIVEAGLALPHVEVHTEVLKALLDADSDAFLCPVADDAVTVRTGCRRGCPNPVG